MNFTRIGRVFAHIFFWYGILGVAVAVYYVFSASGVSQDTRAVAAYLSKEVGQGMTNTLMGLAIGILCEISAKMHMDDTEE